MNSKNVSKIYHIVQSIPCGQVATYAYVAKRAGMPNAARYVGNVLHKNRNPEVPCHRVVRAGGNVGGFRGGSYAKIRLLRSEGVHIRGNCVGAAHLLQ
jgi:O-6-methylguanine DNA methyltransferase